MTDAVLTCWKPPMPEDKPLHEITYPNRFVTVQRHPHVCERGNVGLDGFPERLKRGLPLCLGTLPVGFLALPFRFPTLLQELRALSKLVSGDAIAGLRSK